MSSAKAYRQSAKEHLEAGRAKEALEDAWRALAADPDEARTKTLVGTILRDYRSAVTADAIPALHRLLLDPKVEPDGLAPAGWRYLLQDREALQGTATETAQWLESDPFARDLLSEALVTLPEVEIALTRLRRHLLLEGKWSDFPRTAEALKAQARLNGGAWFFDAEESVALERCDDFRTAYLPGPPQEGQLRQDLPDAVTRRVAEQYEGYPYPQWSRVTWSRVRPLAEDVAKLDPDGKARVPEPPEILVAGCGSGKQTAHLAPRYPDAKITAIDLSQSSLDYAAARCTDEVFKNTEFLQLDLHRVGDLNRSFDAIMCTGVLHHLPNPELGWKALVDVLKPGGVMHVMVYSRVSRMNVQRTRILLGDISNRPITDDLLREVRHKVLEMNTRRTGNSPDFYSLAGVHDLLMHRHEDPFDVPRIRRAMETLDLELLGFVLPTAATRAQYLKDNPSDPHFRDWRAWASLERHNPGLFGRMYSFWCCKRAA